MCVVCLWFVVVHRCYLLLLPVVVFVDCCLLCIDWHGFVLFVAGVAVWLVSLLLALVGCRRCVSVVVCCVLFVAVVCCVLLLMRLLCLSCVLCWCCCSVLLLFRAAC